MKKNLIFFIILFFFIEPAYSSSPKNVILLIGDGMGLSQITYGILKNKETSNFERFKYIGLIKTSSTSDEITDSAAAATAFASGKKTFNGAICVDGNKKSLPTILEIAKANGFATGLIATSSIVHATPAAFISHQNSRHNYEEIALDLVKNEVDVFIGGGLKFFNNRSDKIDLTKKLLEKNYKIYTDQKSFFEDKRCQGRVAALLAKEHMPKMQEGRKDYEKQALIKALSLLSHNKKGFFLMVEGSQIDWGGHQNDAEFIKEEVVDFDSVIGAALDLAIKDKNTLVIVTADHETGGFALSGRNLHRDENYGAITPEFTSSGHSAVMVPVFAYGVGAENFMGIYENTEIFFKIRKMIGI